MAFITLPWKFNFLFAVFKAVCKGRLFKKNSLFQDDFEVKVEVITNTDSENKVIGSFFERLDVLKEENPYSNIYSVQFTSFIFDSSSGLESNNFPTVKSW